MVKKWALPTIDILPKPPQKQPAEDIISGHEMTRMLLGRGIDYTLVKEVHAPQVSKYYFDSDSDEHIEKADKIAKLIGTRMKIFGVQAIEQRKPISHVCISIPRTKPEIVYFADLLTEGEKPFVESASPYVPMLFGKDENNKPVIIDLRTMTHCLIGGTTKSGKSGLIHAKICSMKMRTTPDKLQIFFCDFKGNDSSFYKDSPFFGVDEETRKPLQPITCLIELVIRLRLLNKLMEERAREMNAKGQRELPANEKRIVLIIDELADVMAKGKTVVETPLASLLAKGRSAGIHVILATQRPSAKVLDGDLKNNCPTVVGLKAANKSSSGVIWDEPGLEKLLGRGDCMIRYDEETEGIRMQVPYVSDSDIEAVMNFWKEQAK